MINLDIVLNPSDKVKVCLDLCDVFLKTHVALLNMLKLCSVLVGKDLVLFHESILEVSDDLLQLRLVLVVLLDELARTLNLALEDANLGGNAFTFTLQFGLHVVESSANFPHTQIDSFDPGDDGIEFLLHIHLFFDP